MVRLTRTRFEATATTLSGKKALNDFLLTCVQRTREEQGGEWEIEDPGMDIQTTKDGWWGRVTMRRKDVP